jgi:hypothetical protein
MIDFQFEVPFDIRSVGKRSKKYGGFFRLTYIFILSVDQLTSHSVNFQTQI